jgi:hypothetical protein
MLSIAGFNDHGDCTADECDLADVVGETFETRVEVQGYEKPMIFVGCPAKHLADGETSMWLGLYRWLSRHHKTPADMGVPIHRMDPRYFDAMDMVDWALGHYKPQT